MFPQGIDGKGKHWRHEDGSVQMFQHILKKNNIDLVDYSMTHLDKLFIEEMISGTKEANRLGRSKKLSFLYDIVNNTKSGLDVDKIDYFQRDLHYSKAESVNFDRFISLARVLKSTPIGDGDEKNNKKTEKNVVHHNNKNTITINNNSSSSDNKMESSLKIFNRSGDTYSNMYGDFSNQSTDLNNNNNKDNNNNNDNNNNDNNDNNNHFNNNNNNNNSHFNIVHNNNSNFFENKSNVTNNNKKNKIKKKKNDEEDLPLMICYPQKMIGF
jgi:hypothetical protein